MPFTALENSLSLYKHIQWDAKEREGHLSSNEIAARRLAVEEFNDWAVLEETTWMQKPQEIWLKEGDKNTKKFYKTSNARRRRNLIGRIKINGEWVMEELKIPTKTVHHFKLLLSEPVGEWRPNLNCLLLNLLSNDNSVKL